MNECLVDNGGCDHTCTNVNGTYECSCDAGYVLADNEEDCEGKITLFVVTDST